MKKRILIAEDDPSYGKLFQSWAEEAGFDVIEATTAQEGIDIALAQKPDAIITDFGLRVGNGNDLARRIKQEHQIPIAGITSGDPKSFDGRVVDIAETKTINHKKFRELLRYLAGEIHKDKYVPCAIEAKEKQKARELTTATNILFQGFYLARALKEGLPEIVADGRVILSEKEFSEIRPMFRTDWDRINPQDVFGLFSNGTLNVQEVYDSACRRNPKLREDGRLAGVFTKLEDKDYNFSLEDAVYVAETLGNLDREDNE